MSDQQDSTKPPEPEKPESAPEGAAGKSGEMAKEAIDQAQAAVNSVNDETSTAPEVPSDAAKALDDAAATMSDVNQAAEEAKKRETANPFPLPDLNDSTQAEVPQGIDLISDVQLHVKIELGRTRMYVEDVLRMAEGTVVELDKLAGDPVDIYVNERQIARGEVLVLNDNFCVRINEILATPGDEVVRAK